MTMSLTNPNAHRSSSMSGTSFGSFRPSAAPGPSRQRRPLPSSQSHSRSRASSRSTSLGPNVPLRRLDTPTTASGRLSRAASSIGASEGHQVICAVSEARGVSPSVGVAFINVSTGKAVLSQICDNQSYVKTMHKLTVFEPSRILVVSTACPPNPKSSLHATIEEELPTAQIVPLGRKYWSETAGLEYIQTLAFKKDVEAIKVAIQGNFYATCAFSAVC